MNASEEAMWENRSTHPHPMMVLLPSTSSDHSQKYVTERPNMVLLAGPHPTENLSNGAEFSAKDFHTQTSIN